MRDSQTGVPIEQFIQALTSQLDRAQNAMALKARAGLPLTFAVKDLSLDLRAHVDVVGSVVRIRPAGPGDTDSSNIHIELTTITRPMIEENTFALELEEGEPSLEEAVGAELSPEERRRLEWAGVRTVRQLLDLRRRGSERLLESVVDVPAERLRAALTRAAQPQIRTIEPAFIPPSDQSPRRGARSRKGDEVPARAIPTIPDVAASPTVGRGIRDVTRVKIRGRNLVGRETPQVRIGGEPVRVVEARPNEIVIEPEAHQLSGTLEIEPNGNDIVSAEFDLSDLAVKPEASPPPETDPDDGSSLGAIELPPTADDPTLPRSALYNDTDPDPWATPPEKGP